jgi:ABC-type sugar transport system ATPase subunit
LGVLQTQDLTVRFGGHVAVSSVSCRFEPGTLTAIVGPNGAGKTTYFNLISGQLPANEGRVHLNGRELTGLSASARTRAGLGRAFQLTNLFPNLTVLENVRLAVQATEDGAHLVKWWKAVQRWSMKGRSLAQMAEGFYARVMRPDISWWGHSAAFNYSTADALKKIDQDILILNPQDDLWDFTPRAKAFLKNGRIHDLPGWSHGFLDLKTQETASLVRGFLDAS